MMAELSETETEQREPVRSHGRVCRERKVLKGRDGVEPRRTEDKLK